MVTIPMPIRDTGSNTITSESNQQSNKEEMGSSQGTAASLKVLIFRHGKSILTFLFDHRARIVLGILFLFSFAVPIYIGLSVSGYLTSSDAKRERGGDEVFPHSVSISSQGSFIKIPNTPLLQPHVDEDFVLSAWIKLRHLPSIGEKMVLVSKFEEKAPFYPGYSISLERDGSIVRPIIYWRDSKGRGGLYTFTEIEIAPHSWTLFVLSYHDSLLGLHGTFLRSGDKPVTRLLGGYKLEYPVIPESDADLQVGGKRGSSFSGLVGPIGVFSLPAADKDFDLKEVVKSLSRHPFSIPSQFGKKDVRLWSIDGKKDESSYANPIIRNKNGVETKQ